MNPSSWLWRLPAAEGAAGDSSLELHPEHVSARCCELHAKTRLEVVELFAKLRSLSAIMILRLVFQSALMRLGTKSGDVCLFRPECLLKAQADEVLFRARAARFAHLCNHEVRFGAGEDPFAKRKS